MRRVLSPALISEKVQSANRQHNCLFRTCTWHMAEVNIAAFEQRAALAVRVGDRHAVVRCD